MLTSLLSRDFERFLKTELRIRTDLKDERSYEGRAGRENTIAKP